MKLGVLLSALLGGAVLSVSLQSANAEEESVRGNSPPKNDSGTTKNSSIGGICLDSDSRPIQRATVTLYRREPAYKLTKLQSIRTDDKGAFRFQQVPLGIRRTAPEHYLVTAQAMGQASTTTWVFGGMKKLDQLELTLREAATITGTVTDHDGKPLKDAIVSSAYTPRPLEHVLSGITDEDGKYVITDLWTFDGNEEHKLPDGHSFTITSLSLYARHPDFATTRAPYKKAPGVIDIQLRPAAIVEGRVLLNDGRPAAGVVVHAQGVDNSGWGTELTDEEGRFQIRSLPADGYNIWATKKDWTVVAHDSFEAVAGKTRKAPDLRFVRGGFIAGQLIDADTGKPIKLRADPEIDASEYASVGIYGPSRPRSGAAIESEMIQQDGSYRIRVAPGSNYIYFSTPGPWDIVEPKNRTVKVDEGATIKVDFRVRRR